MEFATDNGRYTNGLGENVLIESEFVYPLLKSSDLGNGRSSPRRSVLVTQKKTGDPTAPIREIAPKTWGYLEEHAGVLDARKSSIYKNRARFSVFGIGDYSFALWKVAISGLYKSLRFVVVPPVHGRPVMLDDTCYFISCDSEREAQLIEGLLNSAPCRRFLESLVFENSKRPITVEVLRRISLASIASRVGKVDELTQLLASRKSSNEDGSQQLSLVMEKERSYRAGA